MLRYLVFLLILFPAAALIVNADNSDAADWRLVEDPGGTALEIEVQDGACHVIDHVNVTETSEDVTIHAYTRDEGDGSCPGMLVSYRYTVKLEQPLGDRVLRGCWKGSDDDCVPGAY